MNGNKILLNLLLIKTIKSSSLPRSVAPEIIKKIGTQNLTIEFMKLDICQRFRSVIL
nr:hypothetical protein [Apibacter muscae]